MPIWTRPFTLAEITAFNSNTAAASLGIEYTEIGDDYLCGRMPVDSRAARPVRAASARAAAERAVGLEINANHVRPVASGWVTGTARALHIGGTTQVWEIRIVNDQGKLTCVSRITMAVIKG